MKKLLILGILFFCVQASFAQLNQDLRIQQDEEARIPFSVAISTHIKKYNNKINAAYQEQDLEHAKFLFDSLVDYCLKGSYMDNFSVHPLKGEVIPFEEYEKPIFLTTYASWCVPGIGEIPALNDLADQFHDQIDFIMLFWDTPEKTKEKAKEYSQHIDVVYVNEKTNRDSHIVNKLKHSLGVPMMFFMDPDKKILDIRKVTSHHSSETLSDSYNIHYNSLSKGVSLLVADLDANAIKPESEEGDDNELQDENDDDNEDDQYDDDNDN